MKIAFLNIYSGLVERGSEVFVKELAAKLETNHDIYVYQVGKKHDEKYGVRQIKGIPFHPHQGPKRSPFYNLWVLLFTLKCLPDLWQKKYDWIIPVNGRWQVLVCRILRFFGRGKILISGHAGIGFEDHWNMTVGKPNVFVALNPSAFSWVKKIYLKERVVYIPNGVDIANFHPEKNNLHLSLKQPVVLCVSALLPYKKVEFLIKAVNKLGSASLLVIGDGPLRKQLEELGHKLLPERFLLIDHVSHQEMVHYYTYAQLFSLPSEKTEAFGLVYLEAMACNLPVVAPDDINRREIIGEAGFLGNVDDIQNYADLLHKALNTDFGNKPRRQAENFSWENIAKKYEKVFEKY